MSKTSHVGTYSPDSVAPPTANPTGSAPAAASREEEPPLSDILDPVELLNQIRQLPPSEWPHGVPQEVQAKMLKPHPPKAWIFEIDIRTDTGLHSLIGKVYATDRPDIYQITEKLRQAGLGPGADFAVPQPVAYVAPLRLLLQERVEGTPGKKVFKYSNDSERGLAAERCARWLARFHAVAAPAGRVADAQKYLDDAECKCRLISAADRSFASRCEHLLERLRAAAPSPGAIPMCAGHGDFCELQAIFAGRRTVVVDWDDYDVAEPTRDVAHFIVCLERLAGMHLGSIRALDGASDVFLKSYLASGGHPQVAANLPFYRGVLWLTPRDDLIRAKSPGWRESAEIMVDEAFRALGENGQTTARTRRWPAKWEFLPKSLG